MCGSAVMTTSASRVIMKSAVAVSARIHPRRSRLPTGGPAVGRSLSARNIDIDRSLKKFSRPDRPGD